MKLNLCLVPDDRTFEAAVRLNQEIMNSTGYDKIAFSGSEAAIPHVTIAMGDLLQHRSLDDLEEFLENEIDLQSLGDVSNFTVEEVYVEDERQRYVFLDFELSDTIIEGFSVIRKQVFGDWFGQNYRLSSRPHLTLGYVDDCSLGVLRTIDGLNAPESIGFSRVALGMTGPKGTVVKILWERGL